MTARDFLWCALNLLLDEEDTLHSFCPQCQKTARQGACPACGTEIRTSAQGQNSTFDFNRYERLKRGDMT